MRFFELAFTEKVTAAQLANGIDHYAKRATQDSPPDRLGPSEQHFIRTRDSFFMATVSETGWPYVQHRGGPVGFVKVLDETRFAIPDYRGNRQYVSLGNLASDDRAALFMVDYPQRARLKLLTRVAAVSVDDDPALLEQVTEPEYRAKIERILVFTVEALDWNCPQHITPRFTEAEIQAAIAPINNQLEAMRAELKRRGMSDAEITALVPEED